MNCVTWWQRSSDYNPSAVCAVLSYSPTKKSELRSPTLLCAGLLAALPAWSEVETCRIDPEHSFANWEMRPIGNEVEVTLVIEGIKLGADGKPFSVKKAAEEKAVAE